MATGALVLVSLISVLPIVGPARALGPDRDRSFLGNNPGSVHPFGRYRLGTHH